MRSMNEYVTNSYYIIKVKGNKIKKDKFVVSGFNGGDIVLSENADEAHRFDYFGLRKMESAISLVMTHIEKLENRGIKDMAIVGEDVVEKASDIKDLIFRRRLSMWDDISNEDTISGMLELSKDEDGEYTEHYVYIHKFLSHIKALDYRLIMAEANGWHKLTETKQSSIAIRYAGGYSALLYGPVK